MGRLLAAMRKLVDWFSKSIDELTNTQRVQETFPPAYDQARDATKVETIDFPIRSDKDTHFTGAIVQNAKEDENLTGLDGNKQKFKRFIIESDQNLAWDIYVWKTDTFDDVDLDLDSLAFIVKFTAAQGEQIGAANQFRYDSGNLNEKYEDLDGTSELHVSIVNRSAAAKIAGANGELVLQGEYEPEA